jgi:hypothetical protein
MYLVFKGAPNYWPAGGAHILWAGPEVPENIHKTKRKHLFLSIDHNLLLSSFIKAQLYFSVDKLQLSG